MAFSGLQLRGRVHSTGLGRVSQTRSRSHRDGSWSLCLSGEERNPVRVRLRGCRKTIAKATAWLPLRRGWLRWFGAWDGVEFLLECCDDF